MSKFDGEPSEYECGAPWNTDDEGGCACISCRKRKRDEAREERRIDDYEDRKLSWKD